MSHSIALNNLFSFADAAKNLKARGISRGANVACLHRWRMRGVRGKKLSAVKIGNTWYTNWAAIATFIDACSNLDLNQTNTVPALQVSNAGHELAEFGW